MLIHNADITGSLTINGIPFNTGSFSGSFTGTIEGVSATASYVEYTNVANKPTLVSGSSQITYSGLTGIPSGIVSGSSQVSFNGIVDKPTLVSGSEQISFNGIVDKPTLVSGSSQITYSGLTGIPSGIVSGSAQIAGLGYATTSSNTFIGNQTITGSIFGTGSLTIDGCITATGQIVAQTINVQQVTSSIVYSCGSNVFGTSLSNTQQFTGSMFITGSNLNANVGSACFQGSVCANNIVLNTSYSAGGTANVQTWQRTGGAVAADMIYNDANTSMNFGTSTAHSLNIKTNNTTALAINSSGIACFACQVCAPAFVGGTVSGTTGTFSGSSTLLTLTSGAGTKAVFATTRNFSVNRNFQIAVDEFAESAFTITPSTTLGGSSYTTPIFTLAAAGAATFSSRLNAQTLYVNSTEYTFANFTSAVIGPRPAADGIANLWLRPSDASNNVGFNLSATSSNFDIGSLVAGPFLRITSTGIACFACQVCAPVAIFSGCVGIGVTSPSQILHLQTAFACSSGVGTALQITSDGAGGDQAWIGVNKGTGNGLEFSVENRDIIFNTCATTPFGGCERMRITSGGDAYIRTTTSAGVNGQSLPGALYLEGYGWNTSAGSENIQGRINLTGAYDSSSGSTEPSLVFSLKGSGGGNVVPAGPSTLTERMRITNAGYIGIGTTDPDRLFHINGNTSTTTPLQKVQNIGTGDAVTEYRVTGASWYVGIDNSDTDKFKIGQDPLGTSDRFIIADGGNVGIGTTSPNNTLTVNANAANRGIDLTINNTTTVARFGVTDPNVNNNPFIGGFSNNDFLFYSNSAERIKLTSTGIACFACQVCAPIFIQNQSGAKTISIVKSIDVDPSTTGYMTINVADYMTTTYNFALDVTAGAYGNSNDGPGVFKFVFGGFYSSAAGGSCVILANTLTNGSWAWNRSDTTYCVAITNTGSQGKFAIAKFDIAFKTI